jgi:predicted ArsR family transcriptional regulator
MTWWVLHGRWSTTPASGDFDVQVSGIAALGDPSALLAAAASVLSEFGYETRVVATGVTLANCPFHALAEDHTDLVCGMNLELMAGLLDGLERPTLVAHLEPAPGRCCVGRREPDANASPSA